jgi:capsular exopolysaccharide synthesis family protein
MNSQTQTNNDEINFAEIFRILRRYKYSIISITIIAAFLAAVFAYFSPNIYSTSATIYIKVSDKNPNEDILNKALGMQGANIDNEIAIIQSHTIAAKALQELNIGTRYFYKHHLKTLELYQDTPFLVSHSFLTKNAKASVFHIKPLGSESFRLTIEPTFKQKLRNAIKETIGSVPEDEKLIHYSGVHNYNENIQTQWFSIKIQKVYDYQDQDYSFTIQENDKMTKFIQDSLSVTPVSKEATMVNITFQDNVAKRAVDVINAVNKAYINDELAMKTQSAKKTLEFLDQQIAAINKTLQKSARNLENYKSKNLVVTLSEKATITTGKLSDLESKLYELNMQENFFQNIASYIKTHDDIDGLNLSGAENANPIISNLLLKIQEQTSLKKSLLIDFTEQHPDVIKITQSIAALKQTLKQTIDSSIRNIQEQKASLQHAIEEHKKDLEALPEQERKLTSLTRSFVVNEKVYSYLLQKRAETAILQSSTVSETRVIDPAYIPDKPVKPKRLFIVIVGLILGMIIGVMQALLRAKLDNTVKTIEDIESTSTLPVYGVIPEFDPKDTSNNAFKEALRVVRTNIEFIQNSDKSKLVTITSSIPMEGKTTIISEIAKIVAKTHKKAIVLDLDMRRARLHEKFALENMKGMSTLLAGKDTISDVIQHSEEDNLDVITAGPTPPNPSELIMSTKMNKIIEFLLTKYDYVFLDTPPIGLVSDAMMLLKVSDLNLFVLKANFSKKEFIVSIERLVEDHKLHNSGIVLNGVTFEKKSGYGFGYGYGYGYSNEYYKSES